MMAEVNSKAAGKGDEGKGDGGIFAEKGTEAFFGEKCLRPLFLSPFPSLFAIADVNQ